jgi:two-component system response regulator PilR (NtrC family)
MANLLVVDDELGMRQFLTHLLQREGHVVRVAENGREALELLREQAPDLIISDIRMPDMDGVNLLRAARESLPEVEVIMMTAFANVDTAREAFLLGAYDFVQKPFDNDLLKETVTRALEKISLLKEKEALLEENKALIQGQRTRGKLGNIIGRSKRMLALYQMIETVAQVQSTVLVTGESGIHRDAAGVGAVWLRQRLVHRRQYKSKRAV